MRKISCGIIILAIVISCKNNSRKDAVNLKKYNLTLYKDKYVPKSGAFKEDDSVFVVESQNDTTAYLNALNIFYREKVKQRALSNYGQPKKFLITDKDNIDLSLKLSERIVTGLQTQVKDVPEVKKMLDDYNRDSLIVDTSGLRK